MTDTNLLSPVEARALLRQFGRTMRGRDDLVRRSLAAGLTKTEVSTLSGLARTTIDRICPPAANSAGDMSLADALRASLVRKS